VRASRRVIDAGSIRACVPPREHYNRGKLSIRLPCTAITRYPRARGPIAAPALAALAALLVGAGAPAADRTVLSSAASLSAPIARPPVPAAAAGSEPLEPIIITAPEPRFVAPTRRDSIGRIWAPVMINGHGPFRLVLDSGASSSGITRQVAQTLGLPLNGKRHVLLRGVVGMQTVPLVRVHSFTAGDLSFGTRELPIVTDALGGADGILGTDGMSGQRILIDFHHDLITIARSAGRPAPAGYVTIPFHLLRHRLIDVDAYVGNVRAQAIIDTGGQTTIANLALRSALKRRRAQAKAHPDRIEDVTRATQAANTAEAPAIVIGTMRPNKSVQISHERMTFGDMHIFTHWHMTDKPAMLIGMDTLGRLDILIIDYRLHELQIRLDDSSDDD